MIVMPANSTGWFFVTLAHETRQLGHLYSPGAQRGPWPWFPYALDNGCFALWNPADNTFDEERWLSSGEAAWRRLIFWAESNRQGPLWMVVPDRPGKGDETLAKWEKYAPQLLPRHAGKLAIAVQDGMTPDDVRGLAIQPSVICVGGSTEWKWATVEMWAREFKRVHLLRCNSPEKLHYLQKLKIESCDGTGWNRGDQNQTRGLEEFCRGWQKTGMPLWPYVCRGEKKAQRQFVGHPTQETFA